MSPLRRRGFQEVRDNLLTTITGGVAAEAHPFPPPRGAGPPFRYSLLRPPVAEVVSVYGSRNRESRLFRRGVDFALLADGQTLEWPEGAELPDEGTVFFVNYRPVAAGAPVTDVHTGSVVRTLAETVALEIARVYAQLDTVYQAGFIDTATGRSLDNLVALLGVERVLGGRAAGEVQFQRSEGSRGTVSIPAGTRVMTEDGSIEYETTSTVTMAEAQDAVRVVARDLERNEPVDAGALVVLPVPIAGIGAVDNPSPTAITTVDETDEELRTRARNFLHGSERGTLGAIVEAVRRQGVDADVVEILGGDPLVDCAVDRVEITPHAESMPVELQQRILTAVERVRPAGVVVRLKDAVAPVAVDVELRVTTDASLLAEERRIVQRQIRDELADYFARLPAKSAGSVNKLVGLVLGVEGVEDVRILSVTRTDLPPAEQDILDLVGGTLDLGATPAEPSGIPTKLGDLRITDPALPTSLHAVIVHPAAAAPPDGAAVTAALSAAVGTLNAGNEDPGDAPTAISFAQLVHLTPLPGSPGGTLADFPGGPAADPAPYQLTFLVTTETGASTVLEADGDAYELAHIERLTLAGVTARAEE